MWTCPKCGAKVDAGFDVCWQCGTSPEGVEDPSFVKADDTPPIVDDPVVPELNTAAPAGELADSPSGELVTCYQALSLMEAKFLADELKANGIPAVSDTQDMQDQLGTWEGNPRVYCRESDLPSARAWLEDYDRRRQADVGRHLES